MYVPVSRNRFIDARSGSISLYDVCKKSENEFVWIVRLPHSKDGEMIVQRVQCEDLNEDSLPSVNSHINLNMQSLPDLEELSPVRLESV